MNMRKLDVLIELNGKERYVGEIEETTRGSAVFSYADDYLEDPQSRAISVNLPLEERSFDERSTKIFFDGLLPEGFTRRSVAEALHEDETDYISILSALGRECLGAVRIKEDRDEEIVDDYIELSEDDVQKLAAEGASESAELVTKAHLSLTGASGKVGLYYDESDNRWYLPIGKAPSTHIVKQSHVRLKQIVANEQLCMMTASKLGIETPESFIIRTGSTDKEDVLFATKRYDRMIRSGCRSLRGLDVPGRLHQEDFSQALGIPAAGKYEKDQFSYLKKMFGIVQSYFSEPLKDQLKLWDMIVFDYLIGNTDGHIKNFSLLYSDDLKKISLAPAYDIVSTIVYDSGTPYMAMSIDGEYDIRRITRGSFENEASDIGLGIKTAVKRFEDMADRFEAALDAAEKELTDEGFSEASDVREKILRRGGISKYI